MASPFYREQADALQLLQVPDRVKRRTIVSELPLSQAALIQAELARVAASGDPIIVGPWIKEPGIELMFWVPFLRWFLDTYSVDPHRLVAISRGGTVGWYHGIADQYVDTFDLISLESIQDREVKDQKHRPVEIEHWEQDLFDRALKQFDWPRAQWIHPAMMFNFSRVIYNAGPAGDQLLLGMTHHRHLQMPPPEDALEGLPEEFVAIRFYTQAAKGALWDEPRTARAVQEFVRLLASKIPVVNLDPGMRFTDQTVPQWDFDVDVPGRIWSLRGRTHVRTNLGVQSWLIGRSKAFAGTLGGLSSIAPVVGVPALTFTALDGYPFLTPYRRYSNLAFAKLGAKYAISNPLRADLPVLVDAFVADITGRDPFPWPVGPQARADGGSSHPSEAAFALVRVPDERWVARKAHRKRLREKAAKIENKRRGLLQHRLEKKQAPEVQVQLQQRAEEKARLKLEKQQQRDEKRRLKATKTPPQAAETEGQS
jgi:hypothetical protein